MAQAVIFDMDGTLFQTDRILEVSLEDTFHYLRENDEWEGETPLEEYRNIMGVPLPEVWKTLLPDHTQEARTRTDAYFLDRLVLNIEAGKGALYPGVEEVFRHLKGDGSSIYIASNGLKKYLSAIVDYYDLDQWVTETFSIEQIESLDKSDLVQQIVEKHQISQGAVVGDRISDIRAAKDNGLVSVGCDFDFAKEEEMAQADYVIKDLYELKSVIQAYDHTRLRN
ncbi:HAD hydrolase-like protein [Halobacillus locisalis]|uniref:HAD hydrolase-like protein n=1 Tax=Halobacillus locisalis TaxID=220753 RepID=A0A838CW05_9BACI|nr:HAD family hydrolase [Halobacillus locisalis]MBA2176103.1 HAD hydrolase-like protein [Halobacillus locisalis]